MAETFIGLAQDRPTAGTSAPAFPPAQAPLPSGPGSTEHPSSNDDGAGKPVVPKQGVLALEPRQPGEGQKSPLPDRPGAGAGLAGGVDAPSSATQRGRAGDTPARLDGPVSGVPLPKDAVLRASAASGQQDPQRDAKEAVRPDAPAAREQAHRPPAADKVSDRRGDAEARKLMLEDGVPERDPPPREEPDLGDLEL